MPLSMSNKTHTVQTVIMYVDISVVKSLPYIRNDKMASFDVRVFISRLRCCGGGTYRNTTNMTVHIEALTFFRGQDNWWK